VHVKARRVQKLRESCLQVARYTLLLLSSLNILKHRKRFISKYDALICKHHNHSRWKPPFAMRVSTEDSKMDGRCSVKASARYACRLRRVASRATTLHLVRNIPRMISNQRLSIHYRSFRERFYLELRLRNYAGFAKINLTCIVSYTYVSYCC